MTESATAHPPAHEAAPAGKRRESRARQGALGRLVRAAALPSGPLLLYVFLACCVLFPYRSSRFRAAGDLNVAISATVEARNALAEGQFPIRVAPRQHGGARYPLFQYYANFPYTTAGAFCLTGLSPYAAWKLAMLGFLMCGGLFVYKTARYLTRTPLASAVGGAVFVAAPYMLTDLNARGAYAELAAFNLLPAALYACLRCLASRRRGWRYVPAAAFAWALVGLSHNITYFYGVLLIGLLLVSMLGTRPRRLVHRFGRLAAAGVLHAGLMLWYVVPQIGTLPLIEMHGQTGNPFGGDLTLLAGLLAPGLRTQPGTTTPNLGLQVGWPVLAGVVLALVGSLLLRRRAPRLVRRASLLLAAAFATAFFLVWSPVNFWAHLPKVFWFVQFPYRLLVFTTLFGALLAACGLAMWTRHRSPRINRLVALAAFVGVAVAASSYVPRSAKYYRHYVREQSANPEIGPRYDYLLSPMSTFRPGSQAIPHAGVDLAGPEFGLTRAGPWLRDNALMRMVPVDRARGLNVQGESPDGPVLLHVQLGDDQFAAPVGPGSFEFSMPLPECFCGVEALLGFHATPGWDLPPPTRERGPTARVRFTSIRFEGAPAPSHELISADEIRPSVRHGRVTKCRVEAERPVLLQLPVFYYPGMMRVTNHGESVPFGNVGRMVAVQLAPGKHRIEVEYAGSRWANVVSGVAWAGVGLVPAVHLIRRRRLGRADAVRVPHYPARDFSLADAGTACAAVLLGAGLMLGGPRLVDQLFGAEVPRVSTTAVQAEGPFAVENAFDGDLATVWAARSADPAKVTIVPGRARPLRSLVLVARKTSLMETWQSVHVRASMGRWAVIDQTYAVPQAATADTVAVALNLPAVDRIELTFSDPVVTTPGGERVSAQLVNPGYSEIKLGWAE